MLLFLHAENVAYARLPLMQRPAQSDALPGLTAAGMLFGALIAPALLGISAAVIALPSLARDLALSPAETSWMLAGYILAQAMFVGIFGRLGDVWGVRSVLIVGATLIAVGSLLSGLGESFAELVCGRLLQGAGAGSLQVVAFATVGARYTAANRAKVLGVVTAFVGVVSGSGTLIGGLLTDALSWRAVMALPALSVLVMAAIVRLVPSAHHSGSRFDTTGAGMVAVLASAIVLLLETPSIRLPSWIIAVVGMIAFLAAAMLWRRVRTVPDGFIPLAVASSPPYVLGAITGLMLGAGYLAMLFAAPLLLAGHGWSATHIGLVLVPAGFMGAASARIAGSLITTHNPFRVTAALAAISAAGLLLAGLAGDTPYWTVLALGMTVCGFAAGQVALLDRVPQIVDPQIRAVATGLFILMFLLGGAIGSALIAALISPLGLPTAVGTVAALPATGVALALASDTTSSHAPSNCTPN